MTAQNILFNDGWQFCLCDIGTELSALPGRHWYDVELPHDWLINDTSKLYETGEGWYRRSLPCSAEQLSGRVLLNFDGVYMNSTLFVNGKHLYSQRRYYHILQVYARIFLVLTLFLEGDLWVTPRKGDGDGRSKVPAYAPLFLCWLRP